MQARHLFWVLVRDRVGPLLRAEGFGGAGQSWRLEHPSGNAALIQVQRSRWNTADSVQFTINLAVASKVVWDWQLAREPGRGPAARPSALYANDCPLWRRIGDELGGDGWWTITTGMRLEPVAASVVEALRGRAIPLLGWLSTSRTCASAPWRQQGAALVLHGLPTPIRAEAAT